MMYSTHQPSIQHIETAEHYLGLDSVVVATSEEHAIEAAKSAEIIFGHRYLRQVMPFSKHLHWVQSTAAGMDRLPLDDLKAKGVTLTRSTLGSKTIARHTYTLMWSLIRGLHHTFLNQLNQDYNTNIQILPEPKRVLVLGTGSIGTELADILNKDQISVSGVNRSGNKPQGFEQVYTGKNWYAALPQTDVLIMALPADITTTHCVNAEVLANLPSHAIVINVGREETLDTDALCNALLNKQLGAAALDVTPQDYRNKNSVLWTTPNLLVTPHNAAHSAERASHLEHFFIQQLARYTSGQNLLNSVSL
ncbi:NAD(P)-dependent oxidoreductase [Aestuariibacter sp. GS-14]|uniref:NAD(P)-dependent oxidoreductase n=1 Tax=Aestuariibacter sp. GS-14 TaxID=2590670 RepID=UPI0015E85D59|nr:NAD(P)-dependent oxidoreductase [Aestuariibacter sp. GS-14]